MRAVASLVIAAALIQSTAAVDSQTLTCSTSFQGYRVCQDAQGYRSTEWDRDGMRFGQDSDGRRWTTSRWRGIETLTVEPPGR